MKNYRGMLILATAGFVVTAIAVVAIPCVLISQADRTVQFWPRISWALFLTLLAWGSVAAFTGVATARSRGVSGVAGITPAALLLVILYAAISFGLMLAHVLVGPGDTANRMFLAVQIAAAVGLAIVLLALLSARRGAVAGAESIPADISTPTQLAALIRHEEARLSAAEAAFLVSQMRTLREKITYSLHWVGAIGRNEDYRRFATDVSDVCTTAAALKADSQSDVDTLRGRFEELIRRVDLIVEMLKRS